MKKDKLTIVLDADTILQNIKQKYGEKTIITEKGKEAKVALLSFFIIALWIVGRFKVQKNLN